MCLVFDPLSPVNEVPLPPVDESIFAKHARILDELLIRKPDADVNDFFDALNIPKKHRSDYAFGEIMRGIYQHQGLL